LKKPAAAIVAGDFELEKTGMKKCGPFREKSYLLGSDGRCIVNVSGKKFKNHYKIVCDVHDWILKQGEAKVMKSDAQRYKDGLAADR
jgi:hypothetical protein